MAARNRRRRRLSPRRRARRWLRRQDRLTRGLLIAVGLLSFLVVALFTVLIGGDRNGQRASRTPEKVAATPPARRAPAASAPAARPAPLRLETRETKPPVPPKAPGRLPGSAGAPLPAVARVAIVIDDLGQSQAHFEQLSALGLPLSIAVIPGLPASERTVLEARRLGIEMLLHQPMEPREETGKSPGEGVLLTSMTPEALRAQVRSGLAAVPGAVGVNNHMGSRFTEDAAGVDALMAELKEQGLFWLDSRTTAATRGPEAARNAGVPSISRDVFLDAEVSADFIRGQLRKLVEIARARGSAVGIGHPHPETIAALREMRDELLGSGVELAPVSRLVRGAPAVAQATVRAAAAARPGAATP